MEDKHYKGTLGWFREQAKKDGFGDNIRDWKIWKIKQKNIEQLKKNIHNIEQIKIFENKIKDEDKKDFYRFLEKVDIKDNVKECWNWTACISPDGYGKFFTGSDKTVISPHRIAYILTKGAIHDGLQVQHTCNNPICCNPHHLELGDQYKNMQYMVKCNRQNIPRGEHNPAAKLTDDKIRKIHKVHKERPALKQWQIAEIFNISQSQIHCILSGKNWSHIYDEFRK